MAVPVETRRDHPGPPARRWGRALAVLAVVAVCAVPATDALASSSKRKPAAPRPKVPATTRVVAPEPTVDLEKESVRRGWAWGQTVRGTVVVPGKAGLQTIQLQRGVVTDLTATTVVVTSIDGVAVTWNISASTAVVVPAPKRRAKNTTSTTSTSTTPPSLTGKLSKGLQVRVWGLGSGDSPSARLLIADPKAPKPTPTPTSTTTTTTTTTTPTTTTTTASAVAARN